jgi:adenylate kinase
LTGQVGLDKGEYVARLAGLASERGLKVSSATVGKEMRQLHPNQPEEQTILNLDPPELEILRRQAWVKILSDTDAADADVFVVNSHAVFRWRHGLFSAIDLDLVLAYQPGLVVTLVDDVHAVKQGLMDRGTDDFDLWEILAWREEEVLLSKFLADCLRKLYSDNKGIDFFIVPKQQGPQLVVRLLTEPDTRKAYLSFPITDLRGKPDPRVEEFKRLVSEAYIAFDPIAMSERALLRLADSYAPEIEEVVSGARDSVAQTPWEYDRPWNLFWDDCSGLCLSRLTLADLGLKDVSLTGREIVSARDSIDAQIISRDFLLIDQSDIVVIYIRANDVGEPQYSAGCQTELAHAYRRGKPGYVIFPGRRGRLSPWVNKLSSGIFETAEDFLTTVSPV